MGSRYRCVHRQPARSALAPHRGRCRSSVSSPPVTNRTRAAATKCALRVRASTITTERRPCVPSPNTRDPAALRPRTLAPGRASVQFFLRLPLPPPVLAAPAPPLPPPPPPPLPRFGERGPPDSIRSAARVVVARSRWSSRYVVVARCRIVARASGRARACHSEHERRAQRQEDKGACRASESEQRGRPRAALAVVATRCDASTRDLRPPPALRSERRPVHARIPPLRRPPSTPTPAASRAPAFRGARPSPAHTPGASRARAPREQRCGGAGQGGVGGRTFARGGGLVDRVGVKPAHGREQPLVQLVELAEVCRLVGLKQHALPRTSERASRPRAPSPPRRAAPAASRRACETIQ